MRVFSAEEKKGILQRAFQKQMLTGKSHVRAAITLMSEARQKQVKEALENDIPAVMNIVGIMDQTALEASNGEFLSWRNLEESLVNTTSPFLRLFNIKAALAGTDQLWDTTAKQNKTPYLKMIQERCGNDY